MIFQTRTELVQFLNQFYDDNKPIIRLCLREVMMGSVIETNGIPKEDFVTLITQHLVLPVSSVSIVGSKLKRLFVKNYRVTEQVEPFGFDVPCGMYSAVIKPTTTTT